MTTVEYEGQLTADDVVAGYAITLDGQRRSALQQFMNFAFWVVMGMTVVLVNGKLRILPLLMAAIVGVSQILTRRQGRANILRLYAKLPALQSRFKSRFDDTGFRTHSDLFDHFCPWRAFGGWKETREHLLVYEGDGALPLIIPKRLFLNPTDLDSLRALLAAHIVTSARVGRS